MHMTTQETSLRDGEQPLAAGAATVASMLRGRSLACAESCTAGLITTAFAAVEGASDWFRGGVIAYQLETKVALLGVDEDVVLVSRNTAEQMALGAARAMHADVVVATTGAAGPSGLDGAPPGTVVLGTLVDGAVRSVERHYDGSPRQVIEAAAAEALQMLLDALTPPR